MRISQWYKIRPKTQQRREGQAENSMQQESVPPSFFPAFSETHSILLIPRPVPPIGESRRCRGRWPAGMPTCYDSQAFRPHSAHSMAFPSHQIGTICVLLHIKHLIVGFCDSSCHVANSLPAARLVFALLASWKKPPAYYFNRWFPK